MKKRFLAIVISIIFATVLISCTSNDNSNTLNKASSVTSNSSTDESKLRSYKKTNDTPTIGEETSVKDTKCKLYFFNTSELKHYYIDKTLPIEDALITTLTKELQSTSYNKDFLSLTDKVEVTSAKLDETTGVLKIVFSDSYVDHMNLGSSTESGLLTSLISTYGYNLGVDKIAIYFNDELYTCLKGDLPNGYFTVEYPPAKSYNP